jgi:hypothetical protein
MLSRKKTGHTVAWHRQANAPGDHRVHADHEPLRIRKWSSRITRRKLHIRLYPLRGSKTAHTPNCMNYSSRQRSNESKRVSDGDHEFADAQSIRVSESGRRQAIPCNTKRRKIAPRVARKQFRLRARAIPQLHVERAESGNVRIRNDDAVRIHDNP